MIHLRVKEDRPDFWPYLLASLLIHALFVILLPMAIEVPKFEDKVVEIIPVIEGERPHRIADIDKPEREEKPKGAKFLGMYDSAVAKEQVAVWQKPDRQGKKGVESDRDSGDRKKKRESSDKLYAIDRRIFEGGAGAKAGEEGSGRTPDDFFPDFHRGTRTYLNVLRYPDVDYFVRLKRAFRVTFNPAPALRRHFSENQITVGSVDVVLGVSVDENGGLAELFIFRSSGIPSYDEEALRTVRASSPFSSPPKKFVDDDGLLHMSWTFTVYL